MFMLNVDSIQFIFADDWRCSKYDEWSFYKAYLKHRDGTKAVDLLAVSPEGTTWFIEVKDYRRHPRTKPICIAEEIAQKVHDTLAGLLAAKMNASDLGEMGFAKSVVRTKKLRVVLHLEQPLKQSRLFPRAIDPANIQVKLRSLLKTVDAHPVVSEATRMQNLPWTLA